jgi:hypothetical protein
MSGRYKVRENDVCECARPFDGTRNPRMQNYPCFCVICERCFKSQVKYCALCEAHVHKVRQIASCKRNAREIWIYNYVYKERKAEESKAELFKRLSAKNMTE